MFLVEVSTATRGRRFVITNRSISWGLEAPTLSLLEIVRNSIYVLAKLVHPTVLVLVSAAEKVNFYRAYPNLLGY